MKKIAKLSIVLPTLREKHKITNWPLAVTDVRNPLKNLSRTKIIRKPREKCGDKVPSLVPYCQLYRAAQQAASEAVMPPCHGQCVH